jgi:hypothetical protein
LSCDTDGAGQGGNIASARRAERSGTMGERVVWVGSSVDHTVVEQMDKRRALRPPHPVEAAKSSDWRLPHMTINKVLAVYSASPLLLVVESEKDKLLELSLKELKGAGHSLNDAVWKSLIQDYQMFNCQLAPH